MKLRCYLGSCIDKLLHYSFVPIIFLCLLPIIAIIASFMQPIDSEVWSHIKEHLLLEYALNTIKLLLVVVSLSTFLGVFFASLVSFCQFPGRKFFMGCLLAPLAFPAYIYAFVYTGIFSYSGLLGFTGFYSFRSFWGLAFTLSLSFYPYVYLLSLQGFSSIGNRYYEISLVNGFSPIKSFFSGALPISLPWIMTGVVLVSLETLADFGAASVFSFDTMTVGIYKTWFGFFSLPTAMRMSTILIGFGFFFLLFKQLFQKNRLYENKTISISIKRFRLGWIGTAICIFSLVISLFMPITQLILWSSHNFSGAVDLIKLASYSIIVAFASAVLINILGFLTVAVMRMTQNKENSFILNLPLIGYGLPGTVIATIIFFLFGGNYGFVGSLILLILAYFIRFFPLSLTTIAGASKRVPRNFEEIAILANIPKFKILGKLSVPLLKSGWVLSFIFLLIEIIKEMPITLIMRPLGYATLATKTFELSSEGEWTLAATPALLIISISSFSVIWIISKRMGSKC